MKAHARAQLLIRRPPQEVFSALVEPRMLERFWLASANGPLTAGAKVRWEFMVPGAVDEVEVLAFDAGRSLRLKSADGSVAEWSFTPRGSDTTVTVQQLDLDATTPGGLETLSETVQGYTLVLCALKVLLEQGVNSRIVQDKAELIKESLGL